MRREPIHLNVTMRNPLRVEIAETAEYLPGHFRCPFFRHSTIALEAYAQAASVQVLQEDAQAILCLVVPIFVSPCRCITRGGFLPKGVDATPRTAWLSFRKEGEPQPSENEEAVLPVHGQNTTTQQVNEPAQDLASIRKATNDAPGRGSPVREDTSTAYPCNTLPIVTRLMAYNGKKM